MPLASIFRDGLKAPAVIFELAKAVEGVFIE